MTDVFNALADKNRRFILELVAHKARTTSSIAKETGLAATALEKHLKTLVEAELLSVITKGKTSTYSLNKSGLAEAAKWFGKFGSAFVAGQADVLGENIGSLISSATSWLEKKVGGKINLDFDPEQVGRELGRKLSDAKREATEKVDEASVKVKTAAKKAQKNVAAKLPAKKAPAKKAGPSKPAAKKAPAKKPVAAKPAAKKPKA